MNNYILVIEIGIILALLFRLFIHVTDWNEPKLRLTHDECMFILNGTMKREFEMRYKLEYELKDLVMLYNFQEELDNITRATMNALSPSLIKELEFFYTRKYIIGYVAKYTEIMLMEFTNTKKIKTM